ncbi:MAG: hypothetical protein WCE62_16405, partial [Polyangiales bacterium]
MAFFTYVLLATAALAGCGETAAPTVPIDAGRDAALDPDGGMNPIDGSLGDAEVPLDGGGDAGPDGGSSWCDTSVLCPACPDLALLCDSDNPCPSGRVCLPTGCGEVSRCFVTGGGACQVDDDCRDPAYTCSPSIGRC